MKLDEARERADAIIALLASGDDPDVARGNQERLCIDVLRVAAQSAWDTPTRLLAREALRVVDAPGERW
jgi:hypothetical protein